MAMKISINTSGLKAYRNAKNFQNPSDVLYFETTKQRMFDFIPIIGSLLISIFLFLFISFSSSLPISQRKPMLFKYQISKICHKWPLGRQKHENGWALHILNWPLVQQGSKHSAENSTRLYNWTEYIKWSRMKTKTQK